MSTFRPVTLITGASSGIGTELAYVFARHGHELVLVARSEPELTALANDIGGSAVRPHVMPMDLTRLDAGARIGSELASRALEPNYVVNNAGFGLVGLAEELDRGDQLAMVDLNVRALTDLSLRWLDSLRSHRGGLLNVASVAGFLPAPGMAVYYATKAYVVSFTEALHVEPLPHGVKVCALCPGPVRTGFQARAGGKETGASWLFEKSAEKVAQMGYDGLTGGKRLVVPGFANKVITLLPRVLPRSAVLSIVAARQRRQRAGSALSWLRKG